MNDDGQIHGSFVMGKSRVKPLRSNISVHKLELTAATLAIQINKLITREIGLEWISIALIFDRLFYCTEVSPE